MVRIEWPLHVVLRVAGAVVALAVLVALGTWGYSWWRESQDRCGEGVVKLQPTGECVGVTDGAYHFAGFEAVEERIAKENAKIADVPHVSVAYLASFTATEKDSNSADSLRHELEGAYLAQYRYNEGDRKGSPKIRLLLANTGSLSLFWRHTVDQLLARKNAEKIVAVAGLGPSNDENKAAQKALARGGLATVASIMTATDIGGERFARVAPTNADEARAGAAYLRGEAKTPSALLIQDAAKGDHYARTLGDAFEKDYRDHMAAPRLTYDSSVENIWQNELNIMAGQLCGYADLDVVYFAGRGRHLTSFLDALGNRSCQDRSFTVMTGDDITNITPAELSRTPHEGLTVLYTGLAHPDMYHKNPHAVAAPSARNFLPGGYLSKWFPSDPLDDGQAIMGHDAVLTVAQGITLAVGSGAKDIDGPSVGRMFQQMRGSGQVPGGSGFLSFMENGNPYNKSIPLLRVKDNGHSQLVTVTAPDGKPNADGSPAERR
ncbi:branched-chain amino acid ABC transporter substrate-binding protein [Streptomyces sp. NPDC059740]|uniref:branched-chain amino acid ABC transporter substrate-binding protein n=1 Tax=Streptomyces sp. NPDC059740 TaxID=3346926 RepID=UPI003659361A